MKVALFVPCYVNQLYPQVGIASYQLLKKLGVDVHYPENQTCCGQPMANSGYESESVGACQNYVQVFQDFDKVVTPSGSCTYFVKNHYNIVEQTPQVKHLREDTHEICEFMVNVLKVKSLEANFPHKVGVHKSCHGLRGLGLASCSERVGESYSYMHEMLQLVKGIELIELSRADECCGFGGTFAVAEEAVSARMGNDRVADHLEQGAEFITGGDSSCLMHLEGIVKKNKLPLGVKHIVEILNA